MNENLRENIIKTASNVFAHYGYAKTSIEQIAKELRKSKTVIYYYFKNKYELFEAVVDNEANQLKQKIEEEIKKQCKASEKLKCYIQIRMKELKKLINIYKALKDEYFDGIPEVNKIRRKFDEEETQYIKNILREGIKTKEFKIKNLDLTSLAIVTAMKGLELPLLTHENINLEKRLNYLCNILFYGIINKE
ncbi:MAG: TetR/AcrR family transcriptional regulator [Bacteroidales bacterium]|nr:TetR/AcrR family transcriptional regulator [Bacteroidales bacterium]